MGVSLTKGGNADLTKTVQDAGGATLTAVLVGLGWKPRSTDGQPFDLDSSAALTGEDDKVIGGNAANYVFYNNLKSPDGSVEHTGDNLTGEGEGDDEAITVNLAAVPADVKKIVFPVSIYDAAARGNQTFGQVSGAYIRVVNQADGTELARYDLSEDASTEAAMIFGELYRHDNGNWKFRAVGQGFADAKTVATRFGV